MRITKILEIPLEKLDKILILGQAGIGKTEIIRNKAQQEALKRDKIFIDLREATPEQLQEVLRNPEAYFVYIRIIATHIFPEDMSIPKMKDNHILFLSPLTLEVLRKTEGIMFIDELTNVQRTDQLVLFYSLIQEKEIGWNLKIPNIKIIVASNKPEHSSNAQLLPAPLVNRMTIIEADPPTLDEWYNYMEQKYGEKWDKRIFVYLKMYPDDFTKNPDDTETLNAYPTPRAWTKIATTIQDIKDDEILREIIVGTVGEEAGAKLISFLESQIPPLEEFMKKPQEYWSNFKNEQKYLMLYSISRNTQRAFKEKKMIEFYKNLVENEQEYAVLLVLLTPREQRYDTFLGDNVREHTYKLIHIIREYLKIS